MRFWLFLAMIIGPTLTIMDRPSAADRIDLPKTVQPGGLIIGTAPSGSVIHVDGRNIRVTDDGEFLFGAGRNAKEDIEVIIDRPNGTQITRSIKVTDRQYDIQRIDGLPSRKVTPNKEDQARIEADYIVLTKAKSIDSDEQGFRTSAVWPSIGRISGVFGSQRILNGKPKSPHRGVDVAAPIGTSVKSMLAGVVTVAAEDMYYTGGTVMVDHGHGLKSIYAHLSKLLVSDGQRLSRGEPLGEIGATGRVTGPHLHFGLYWFDMALDPALLLDPMPSKSN